MSGSRDGKTPQFDEAELAGYSPRSHRISLRSEDDPTGDPRTSDLDGAKSDVATPRKADETTVARRRKAFKRGSHTFKAEHKDWSEARQGVQLLQPFCENMFHGCVRSAVLNAFDAEHRLKGLPQARNLLLDHIEDDLLQLLEISERLNRSLYLLEATYPHLSGEVEAFWSPAEQAERTAWKLLSAIPDRLEPAKNLHMEPAFVRECLWRLGAVWALTTGTKPPNSREGADPPFYGFASEVLGLLGSRREPEQLRHYASRQLHDRWPVLGNLADCSRDCQLRDIEGAEGWMLGILRQRCSRNLDDGH